MNDDLISRSALKEQAETVTLWNGDVRRFVSYETIDNAPTVEDRPTVYVVPQECIKVLADAVVDVVQKIDWNSLIKIVAEKEAENE